MKHKPHFGTEGQRTTARMGKGGANRAGGGAMGQPMGSQNKACQPAFGASGQPKATNRSAASGRATNARRRG